MGQSIFTIITNVDPHPARAAELEAYLAKLDAALTHGTAPPLGQIETLHFCSFTVFAADEHFGPRLVFENNIDGSVHAYIERICKLGAPVLHAIYCFCPGYAAAAPDPVYLRTYLCEHLVGPDAAFVGNVGRTAQRIRDEAALVSAINDFLDGFQMREDAPADEIFAAVRDFVARDPRWDWTAKVPPRLSFYDRFTRWAIVPLLLANCLSNPGLTLALIGAFLVVLRRHERTDPVDIPGPPPDQLQRLTAREDQIVQNHMSSLCYLKPGEFRRRTLKLVLFLANLVARISTRGRLIGLDSLHFAHWSLVDGDTRMLFLTNYDGSWENYLDDFIDKAAAGLTAIWSNTLNFPRTSFLMREGARDERRFKAIARTTQAYTNLWYSAYPMLTVNAIEKNTAICNALSLPLDAAGRASWLAQF